MIRYSILLLTLIGTWGGDDPSMQDTLVEYDLPQKYDLRTILDRFYDQNPFIRKNISRCTDEQLWWYAKNLSKDIEMQFCEKAVSTSDNRRVIDQQDLYEMMQSDRSSDIKEKLDIMTPPPLIDHTPFPVTSDARQRITKDFSLYTKKMDNIRKDISQKELLDTSKRQIIKNNILNILGRFRTEAKYVLKTSVGLFGTKIRKENKEKINLLSAKDPEQFTQSDLRSLFYVTSALLQIYKQPVEGLMQVLSMGQVTLKDMYDVVNRIKNFYVTLSKAQQKTCDRLAYLTVLQALLHIQKSCALMVDKAQQKKIEKAVFDSYIQCYHRYHKKKDTVSKSALMPGKVIDHLVPPPALHAQYAVWKSYLEDLIMNIQSKIHRDDFCQNVHRYCDAECAYIEKNLNAKIGHVEKNQHHEPEKKPSV